MKISLKSLVDYECDEFRFRASSIKPDTGNRILATFHAFQQKRTAQPYCSCHDKDSPFIKDEPDKNEISVVFGWFCKRCLRELERMLTTAVPEILSCSIGENKVGYPPRFHREIEFRGAVAELEDGSFVELLPFAIQMSAVTIGQFSKFAEETAYITSAEQNGQYGDDTYKKGPTIDPVKKNDRPNLPACSLSYLDAVAYCSWAMVRLPTEAELLAASLVDKRLMEPREKGGFLFGMDGRFRTSLFPDCLDDLGVQWVTGQAPVGYAIVRTGPFLVREPGWQARKNRHEWPVDAYDLMCGFRTCRTID